MTMNSNNKYGLEYAGAKRRTWKWKLGCFLWELLFGALVMMVLWWLFSLVNRAASLGDVMPPMRRAGFPDWVAFGAVGTVVAFMLARLAWDVCVKPDCGGNDETRRTNEEDREEPGWMRELMGLFSRRGILLTRRNCEQMRALCAPDHPLALVMLDSYLRRELGTRLFVTSLMEIQSVCAKGLEPLNGEGVAA
jgi:hypothetical protein